VPLLADRGVHLSREHVYRLVTKMPQRLNLEVLAALCDVLDCQPTDLMTPVAQPKQRARAATREAGARVGSLRPIRARVPRPGSTE